MWSPRAQSDRARFIQCWRGILENTPNLSIWQDMVTAILTDGERATGVRTSLGVEFHAGRSSLRTAPF